MTSTLRVSLNNQPIGTLTRLPSGNTFFAFSEDYLATAPATRPVLSQSFIKPSGELIPESRATSGKLPPFFSNLLPEGTMRDYLAKRGGIKPGNEFGLLELLGQDLSGAVQVTAETGAASDSSPESEAHTEPLHALRFSLAGVQLKFSAIAGKNSRLTIPASGMGGDWIVKLPAQNYPHVPENEFAMMDLAGRIGIPVPEVKLINLADIGNLPEMGLLSGTRALAVSRFDRAAHGQRIHIEDFAQVYAIAPENKYEGVSMDTLAGMVWTLTGEAGLTDFIRRVTYILLIGNGDMHLKNWSLIYRDGITPALAPAYDMLSTVPYLPEDELSLKLAGQRSMRAINADHFRKLARKAGVPERLVIKTVRETVEATRTAWAQHGQHYDLPTEIRATIEKHMATSSLANTSTGE